LRGKDRKIALVASVVARYDAISLAVRDTFFALKRHGFEDVVLFCGRCEYDDMNAVVSSNVAVLLKAKQFLDADLILYHFGIYHPLFDALLVGNGRAKQAVFYHNVTPPQFVPEGKRDIIERSLIQQNNLRCADRLWPVSPFNAQCLLQLGFDAAKIEVIPLVVDKPAIQSIKAKPHSPLQILFVGRAVESKGLIVALIAFEAVHKAFPTARFVIASNVHHSDTDYLSKCNRFINEHDLYNAVIVAESPDDNTLCALYRDANILLLPTRHEGFCVPVVEGLRASVIPVGFDAGNMKNVCEGLGRLVEPDDVQSLIDRLIGVACDLSPAQQYRSAQIELDRGILSLDEFDAAASCAVQKYRFDLVGKVIRDSVAVLLREAAEARRATPLSRRI
jgi:glycosyltransferase involved in cell wall biosynthesis